MQNSFWFPAKVVSHIICAPFRHRMCAQLECWIFASKHWTKLEHEYYFCAKFLEEPISFEVVLIICCFSTRVKVNQYTISEIIIIVWDHRNRETFYFPMGMRVWLVLFLHFAHLSGQSSRHSCPLRGWSDQSWNSPGSWYHSSQPRTEGV